MSVLAWVALGPPPAAPRRQQSLYEREIKPHEKKLVWYRFNETLPNVASPDPVKAPAPRGEVRSPRQTIVSRSASRTPSQQMTLAPAPELRIEPDLASPNLLAFEAPKPPPKLFVPPPRRSTPEQQLLEDAPELAAAEERNPLDPVPRPRIPAKKFTPPEPKRGEMARLDPAETRLDPATPTVALPQAPLPARPKPRAFTPPPSRARTDPAPVLEAAPGIAPQSAELPLDARVRVPPKRFTAPERRAGQAPVLESAPQIASGGAPAALDTRVNIPRPQPKKFTAPDGRQQRAAVLENAPELDARASNALPAGVGVAPRPQPRRFTAPVRTAAPEVALDVAGDVTAAVVGMNPTDRKAPVVPEISRAAEFSVAPNIARDAAAPSESAMITVPGLSIRNTAEAPRPTLPAVAMAAPTSRENLLAAARMAAAQRPPISAAAAQPAGVRVGAAPDPAMSGRIVYTVALQMPNVTSYSGSWILWYAERARNPGEGPDLTPPKPLRKVDPIYDLSAVDDRVEGKVQLSAIIHTDGYVYGIKVLRGLDPRLDNNAVAALRKWEFEPARRDGVPVDVDVVIEIPFRLQPKK
jgi:TonB family protein